MTQLTNEPATAGDSRFATTFCRPLKRALKLFSAETQGGAPLRSACPGLNSSARSAGSLNDFIDKLKQFLQRFINRPHPDDTQTQKLLES